MLRDLYPLAVNAGIPATEYWDMTLDEITIQSAAIKKQHQDALKERAVMDHRLSQLLAFAFNEPNKMPSVDKMYGFLNDATTKKEIAEPTPEWKKDQAEFIKQALAIKQINNAKRAQGGE
ncbi:hypothetical protein [Levilactobacillus bambusae]|uniref:Uncharacterized protein n=1 Tax=Levilactobacillus bambusae TaxID=2024736 RepID=A0A2V1N162_9LACO|nr:hypothetical protein [Levilactobacillus bambusae]PWG00954.1 hypothetical protein DCM90_01900 [Levilactobacillus bambusae]